jgi:hypothetical protein
MVQRRGLVRAFEVSGEGAMAWYFVMAHWPNQESAPQLSFQAGPIRILIEMTAENLFGLRLLLTRQATNSDSLGKSCKALLIETGHLLPEDSPSSARMADAG